MQSLRIFHIDDQSRSWRNIPHRLFDRLFDALPEKERDLLLLEEDEFVDQGMCVSAFHAGSKAVFFRYYLFDDPDRLLEFDLLTSDVIISDLVGSARTGNLMGFGHQCRSNALAKGLRPENIIYFSAHESEEAHQYGSKVLNKREASYLVMLLLVRLHIGGLLNVESARSRGDSSPPARE